MIVYDNVYLGDDPVVAEQQNFLAILANLQRARQEKETIVLMSVPSVFDLSKDKIYFENDLPNSTSSIMMFLAEAERRVLAYEKGYVFRVQGRMSSYTDVFERMKNYKGVPTFREESLFLLAEDAYAFLFLHYKINAGNRRVVHLASSIPFDVTQIWFEIRNFDPLNIDNKSPTFTLDCPPGKIWPSTIMSESFYKGFVHENLNSVRMALRAFRSV